jgi:hypothetical protein
MFVDGASLSAFVFAGSATQQLPVFFLVLFGFGVTFNMLAAACQAHIVRTSPAIGRNWLTAAILLGAAVGPPLHGAALGWFSRDCFIAFAMFSAVAPALWAWRQRAYEVGPGQPA